MRMSHVDQPLMLMELLGHGFARQQPAPAQDVARRILGEDVTQIDDYTERVKRMVGKVHLQRHHPLQARLLRHGGRVELSDAERDQLLELCCLLTQKPAASPTGAATARRSAARSKTGCSPAPKAAANAAAQAVAWQTLHQRALEVDHIVPRNHGGSNELSNLQALCFRCNAGKRDGCLPTQEGSTDFRGL
jgi:hypothetical protein